MLNSVACKSSSEGTFWTRQLSMTIVACGMLRVKSLVGFAQFMADQPDQEVKVAQLEAVRNFQNVFNSIHTKINGNNSVSMQF